jgi:hypothetical protein
MMYVSSNEKAVSLNVHRYNTDDFHAASTTLDRAEVGLCTLNQVDP